LPVRPITVFWPGSVFYTWCPGHSISGAANYRFLVRLIALRWCPGHSISGTANYRFLAGLIVLR
jgi:hypothetical protein